MPAIMVGTATIATQAEILRMSAFWRMATSFWRRATWVRLAWRTLVSSSRKLLRRRPPAAGGPGCRGSTRPVAVQAGHLAEGQAVERLGEGAAAWWNSITSRLSR